MKLIVYHGDKECYRALIWVMHNMGVITMDEADALWGPVFTKVWSRA